MKTALAFLALLTLSLRADITINDNGTVTKDGASLNNASDALLNKQITSAEFMAALQAKIEQASAAAAKAQEAQQRAEAKLKMLVDGAKDAMSKKTSEQRLAAGNALLTQVTASQTDEERAALLKKQTEIAAKLKALEAK
ncbi:MAG: hypothetical protein K9N47_05500 [Prosthecobacter sp.]|uniref:hypothetical protein n=1 Tax=Prosthecobacter sp. TaxID=1965333 RepID=UPI0025DB689B|nr:hypothetical protein [Prosthecobacter sp.]MCF7785555.1 hypothetical protein [Prosthecobacter sp.]